MNPTLGTSWGLRTILAAILLLLLTGCMGRFERPHIPSVINDQSGRYSLADYQSDLRSYGEANAPVSADDAAALSLRNKMVHSLLAEIDYVFYDYETKLFLNQGTFNVGSDALQLGLAAGGTITNGQRSKTILSALLSGVSGTSLSVDKNFFRQQTVQAISSAMEANRDRIKTVILQQLKQDNATYPFAAARADLIRYFFAGTLPSGLQQLSQQAATNAQNRQADLNQIQVSNITKADVDCVTGVNATIAKDFQGTDLSKEIKFLSTLGATVDQSTGKDKIEALLRDFGQKIVSDPALRQKYCAAAKDSKLIS